MKYYGPLTTPRVVNTGQSYNVAAGAIVDIAAELLGSDSLVGELGFDTLSLAG